MPPEVLNIPRDGREAVGVHIDGGTLGPASGMTRKSSGSSASDLELRSCRSSLGGPAPPQRGRTSAAGVGKPLPSLYPRKVKKELDSEI